MNRRALDFQDFDAVVAEVSRLQAKGYERLGNWSLGQVCVHLALTLERSMDGFPKLMPTFLDRSILELMFKKRRMRSGVEMPDGLDPLTGASDADGVSRLQAALRRYSEHRGEYPLHPYFGAMSADEWRQLHLIHCSHHLGFLNPRA